MLTTVLMAVEEKVIRVLMRTLSVDKESIRLNLTLKELGAVDVDYLNIAFELREEFGIVFHDTDFVPTPDEQSTFNLKRLAPEGVFTPAALLEIKQRFPFADMTVLEADSSADNFVSVYTVAAVIDFVLSKANTVASKSEGF